MPINTREFVVEKIPSLLAWFGKATIENFFPRMRDGNNTPTSMQNIRKYGVFRLGNKQPQRNGDSADVCHYFRFWKNIVSQFLSNYPSKNYQDCMLINPYFIAIITTNVLVNKWILPQFANVAVICMILRHYLYELRWSRT